MNRVLLKELPAPKEPEVVPSSLLLLLLEERVETSPYAPALPPLNRVLLKELPAPKEPEVVPSCLLLLCLWFAASASEHASHGPIEQGERHSGSEGAGRACPAALPGCIHVPSSSPSDLHRLRMLGSALQGHLGCLSSGISI